MRKIKAFKMPIYSKILVNSSRKMEPKVQNITVMLVFYFLKELKEI